MAAQPPDLPSPARPLTGGAVMSATSRVTVAVTGALTTVFVARLLGPEGAGGFAIALTLVLLLTTVASLGVEHGIAYYVSSARWGARDALRVVWRLAAVVGVLVALAGLGLRLLVPSAFGGLSPASTAVVVGAMPFALMWFYGSFVALAVDRYEIFALPPALQSGSAMVLAVVLGLAAGLPGAVLALAVSHLLAAVAVVLWARRAPRGAGDGHPRQLRRSVSFGLKGYAANALQFLNHRFDLFIVSAAVGAAAVGQLAVAIAVTSVLLLLPQALSDVLFPRVAALSAGRGAHDRASRAFVEAKGMRHAVMVITAGVVVLAGALLVLVVPVFGEEFRPAIGLGLILLPGVALIGIGQILSATIVGRGRPIYSLYSALIVTPLTIGLYIWLVPALGAQGAALAKTASYTLSFALALFFYRRVTGAAPLRLFVPTREELADLRALAPAIRTWLRARVP